MWGRISNQLRSVIEWANPSSDVIFEKWSANSDEIKNASKLIVGPGQGCIFVYEGRVEGVYTQEGIIELKTANIPFWTTVTKFMQAFQSEHKVGIYFFKQSQIVNLKWGTPSVIKYVDPQYKFPVGLRAFGNFSAQIQKPDWFLQNIMAARDSFTTIDLRDLIVSRILQPLTDYLAQAKFSYADIDPHRSEIGASLKTNTAEDFQNLGFLLTDFRVEGTSFDDDTMKRINLIANTSAEAQAASLAGVSYAQMQQLEALKSAAQNPGGAGMAMGMGVGLGFGQQVAGAGGAGMGVGAAATAGADDLATRLKKLKELLDQGLISQDEFEAKRKDIISKV
jgi:membrane protease subunit (stomatin/prohibitin family)